MEYEEATLIRTWDMTPTVKQFVFEREEPLHYEAGQHTVFLLDVDGDTVKRPYTMTSLPGTKRFTVAVKRYENGTGSVAMHALEPGDTVKCSEAKGNLKLQSRDRDVVFLSTGTGATPMIAMLREYARNGDGCAYYLHGEKTEATRLYVETADVLDAEHGDVSVAYSLSDQSWNGREGFVQRHVQDVVEDVHGTDFYVCGVPAMVVDTVDHLRDLGVADERIVYEGWEEEAV